MRPNIESIAFKLNEAMQQIGNLANEPSAVTIAKVLENMYIQGQVDMRDRAAKRVYLYKDAIMSLELE